MPARRSNSAGSNGRACGPCLPAVIFVEAGPGRMLQPDNYVQAAGYRRIIIGTLMR